ALKGVGLRAYKGRRRVWNLGVLDGWAADASRAEDQRSEAEARDGHEPRGGRCLDGLGHGSDRLGLRSGRGQPRRITIRRVPSASEVVSMRAPGASPARTRASPMVANKGPRNSLSKRR